MPQSDGEVRSAKARAESPQAAQSDLAALVDGNSDFAFDLYRNLGASDGNLFFSPYSISLALAMTYAGARGETESQMAETLGFRLPQDSLHPAFNALDIELASRAEARSEIEKGFELNIANAVWGQEGYNFRTQFLDLLAENYGAGVRPADFRSAPDQWRIVINDWVASATEDKIKDLIAPGLINRFTRMVLTNAIYFKAAWLHPFNEDATMPRRFTLSDGSEIETPMMRVSASFGYGAGDGYQAVNLPYEGSQVAMTILLPDQGRFSNFQDSLDAAAVSRIIGEIKTERVTLIMPNFKYESQFGLAKTLQEMGMSDAFSERASDFSGMDGQSCLAGDDPCLRISEVVHKAFVAVDEEGTEAAAATAVLVVEVTSAPPDPPIQVMVDHPFIFLIRDMETNAILFLGRVLDPRPQG